MSEIWQTQRKSTGGPKCASLLRAIASLKFNIRINLKARTGGEGQTCFIDHSEAKTGKANLRHID